MIHYPIPIHLQKAYHLLGYQRGDFPISEAISEEIFSLPMFPEITKEEIECVGKVMKEFLELKKGIAVFNGLIWLGI